MRNSLNDFQIVLEQKYGEVFGDTILTLMTGVLCCSLIKEWGKTDCQPIAVLYERPEDREQLFEDLKIFPDNREFIMNPKLERELAEVKDDIAFVVCGTKEEKNIERLLYAAEMGILNKQSWAAVLMLAFRYNLPDGIGDDLLLFPLWRMRGANWKLDIQTEKYEFLQKMVKFVLSNQEQVQWKLKTTLKIDSQEFWERSIELLELLDERERTEDDTENLVERLRDSVRQFMRISEEAADNSGLADAFLREFQEAYTEFRFAPFEDMLQDIDTLDQVVVVTKQEYWLTDQVFKTIARPLLYEVCLRQIKEALKDEKILRTEGRERAYFTKKEAFQNRYGDLKRVRLLHLRREKIDKFGELTLLERSKLYWREDETKCILNLVRK